MEFLLTRNSQSVSNTYLAGIGEALPAKNKSRIIELTLLAKQEDAVWPKQSVALT